MHLALPQRLIRTLRATRAPSSELRGLTELWAISAGASVWLVDLEPYQSCRVMGVVRRLRLDPAAGEMAITINDGTSEVAARWTLRRSAPELALVPGTAVALCGIAMVADDGRLTLQEPEFQTISGPASRVRLS